MPSFMLELAGFPFEKTKIYVNVLWANNSILLHEQETN